MRRFFTVVALLLFPCCVHASLDSVLQSLQEQDQEKAFRLYLKELDEAKKTPSPKPSPEEVQLYEEALALYQSATPPEETALKLLDRYKLKVEQHRDYLKLRLLIALAHANLEEFKDFFTVFYPSYCAYPGHYLSYKTKAILHIKLFERSRSIEERERESAAVRLNVELALRENSEEIGLYKLKLLFAEEKNKERELEACLNKILNSSMIISRSDLPFFAEQALDLDRIDLTKRLIEKARHWYPSSRTLDALQQRIKNDPQ